MTAPTASRVARAEAAYQRAQRAQAAAHDELALRYAAEHRESQQTAQRERMAVTEQWAGLRASLAWYRREWQGAYPATLHRNAVEPGDAWGAPELAAAWRRYLEAIDQTPREQVEPLRAALVAMASSPNRYDRLGARYLFVLACRDFDPVAAGWGMRDQCVCLSELEHVRWPCPSLPMSDEWSPWYAERAIERLRQLVVLRAQRRPGIRHISEAQAIAEAAG